MGAFANPSHPPPTPKAEEACRQRAGMKALGDFRRVLGVPLGVVAGCPQLQPLPLQPPNPLGQHHGEGVGLQLREALINCLRQARKIEARP